MKMFIPLIYESYFYVSMYQGRRPSVRRAMNVDHHDDHDRIAIGNCFRTEDECAAMCRSILAIFGYAGEHMESNGLSNTPT